MAYTPKKYTRVQLVAYHTPTFLGSLAERPAPVAPLPPAINSLMNLDEKSRAARMYLVAAWAATHANVDRAGTTLKLFVAPEFYFKPAAASEVAEKGGLGGHRRSAGQFGAYSFNTMMNLLEVLKTMFQQPAGNPNMFQDWLIVPGTVISDLPPDGKTYGGSNNYILNTAPVIKGSREAPFHLVQKHLVSGIDGPPISNGVYSTTNVNSPYKATLDKLTVFGDDEASARFFTVDGIKFALEVCLDHGSGVLKKTRPNADVDIHILTSCGMGLKGANVLARKNGYAMSVDGIKNFSFPRSDVRKVTVRGGNGATLEASKWDCSTDQPGGQDYGPWRAAEPALTGTIRGRAAIPEGLQVKPLPSVTVYKNGVASGTYTGNDVSQRMFSEEIVWHEPVVI